MKAAAWYPANPMTLRSSMEIAGSVLLDMPYRDAPVSRLYYEGRRQELAFEEPGAEAPIGATMSDFGRYSRVARRTGSSGSAP